ncbi:MAG: acylglycerol kinase family protein [Actinomycetes bacterium]
MRSVQGDPRELARRAVLDGTDALVALSGDGIVHIALQALSGTDVPLGIVPAGSGDDLARAAGTRRGGSGSWPPKPARGRTESRWDGCR